MQEKKSNNFEKNEYLTPINLILVLLNILVFVILSIMGDTNNAEFMYNHGAMFPQNVFYGHEYYRLLSSAFLHFGSSHLLNNMIMLFFLGSFLEHALGKFKYLIFYVISCIGSSAVSMMWMLHTQDYAVSGGASGAIFAIIGGLLAILLKHHGNFRGITIRRFMVMLVLSVIYGFGTAGVDNAAHIGGLVIGFVLGLLFYWKKKEAEIIERY